MQNKNKKGFTLVELVIVIAVIAILAAVLIPVTSSVIGNAHKSAVTQEATHLKTEILGVSNADFNDYCKKMVAVDLGASNALTAAKVSGKTTRKLDDLIYFTYKEAEGVYTIDELGDAKFSDYISELDLATKDAGEAVITIEYDAANEVGKITYTSNDYDVKITAAEKEIEVVKHKEAKED